VNEKREFAIAQRQAERRGSGKLRRHTKGSLIEVCRGNSRDDLLKVALRRSPAMICRIRISTGC
jgi:hypothetical protein